MQEESLEKENSIQHRVTKEDVKNSIKEYLGKYVDILKKISLKEYEIFQKLLPKVERTAYFVKGSKEMLKKFKAFFIAKCSLERYEYSSMMLKNYVEGLTDKNDNELFIAGINRELMFLYLHKATAGIGNTDNWMAAAALDRIVNRERKGLITVLLSERDFPQVENSDEVKKIDLGGAFTVITAENAIQSMKKKESMKNTDMSKFD